MTVNRYTLDGVANVPPATVATVQSGQSIGLNWRYLEGGTTTVVASPTVIHQVVVVGPPGPTTRTYTTGFQYDSEAQSWGFTLTATDGEQPFPAGELHRDDPLDDPAGIRADHIPAGGRARRAVMMSRAGSRIRAARPFDGASACARQSSSFLRRFSRSAVPPAPVPHRPSRLLLRLPPQPRQVDDRKYTLDQVDDALVAQLYADGFSSLSLKEKTLVWHLSQAALAGRDIFLDQKHKDALAMRGVLEQIVAHSSAVDAATLKEIQRYTKLFWLNNGPYNNLTARKFVLTCTPEAFTAAAKAAAGAGATFGSGEGESLDALLTRLRPMFFDPNHDPASRTRIQGRAKTSCKRARTTCTWTCRWPTSRASPSDTASTRAW